MLKITNSTKKMTPVDKQVRIMAATISAYCDSFEDFEEMYNKRIKTLPRVSTAAPELDYRLKKEAGKLTLWHKDNSGNYDRILLIVTEEGKAY